MPWLLFFCFLTCSLASADIETWTAKNGKTAEMELLSVTKSGEVVTGAFRMKDGAKVSIDASRFTEPDEKRIKEWNEMTGLSDPQFKCTRIPKIGLFNQNTGYSGAESLEYCFSFPDPRIVGIRKDGIVIHSCSLTGVNELPGSHVYNLEEESAPKISEKSWSLGACRDYRMAGYDPQRRGLSVNFTLNNGGDFIMEQARNSGFKAEVIVAASNNLKVATLNFSPRDCLVGDHVIPRNGPAPTNEKIFRNVGPIRIWLEEQFVNPSAEGPGSGPRQLVVRIDEPYAPSSVKSVRILSNGEPVRRLSEVTSPEITVKLECWTDFKEMKLLCEKKPSDPGA